MAKSFEHRESSLAGLLISQEEDNKRMQRSKKKLEMMFYIDLGLQKLCITGGGSLALEKNSLISS